MFSIPPATTMSASPSMILCAPSIIAFIPLAQTLLTVVQFTFGGSPASIDACRAGACPRFACNTQPIKTSCTIVGSIPAFSIAPLIAMAPSFVAGISFNDPPKLPIGVRTAEMI